MISRRKIIYQSKNDLSYGTSCPVNDDQVWFDKGKLCKVSILVNVLINVPFNPSWNRLM